MNNRDVEIESGLDEYEFLKGMEKEINSNIDSDKIISDEWNQKKENTEKLKKEYPFLVDFMKSPERLWGCQNIDFNQEIAFVNESEYSNSILNKTGSISIDNNGGSGTKYFIVGKNNEVRGVTYVIEIDGRETIDQAYYNVGELIKKDDELILINDYSNDINENTLFIMKIPK